MLGKAHESCKKSFYKALQDKQLLIVVDNTNTKFSEMKPYIVAAKQAGYDISFVRLITPVEIAFTRNTHRVPLEVIRKMEARMEKLPSSFEFLEKIVDGTI